MKKGLLIGIFGLTAVLFLVVTLNVINGNLDTWNEQVYNRIASWRSPMRTHIMVFCSFWGQWFVCLIVSALLLAIPKTRKQVGIPITLATFSAISLGYVLKRIIAIPRPDVLSLIEASGYGHPSGHTTRATVIFGICALIIWKCTCKKSVKILGTLFAALLSTLMGFSRIYLGVHTATDTVAAYLTGIFIIAFWFMVLQHFDFWEKTFGERD